MGSILRNWLWGGNPEEVNVLSGLRRREVYAVRKSWELLFKDIVAYGSELFIRLIRMDEETKQAFKMLRNMCEEELRTSFQFKTHVINVISSLDSGFKNLNQPELVVALMDKLGESHAKRKIKVEKFLEFKKVLKQLLHEHLSDPFTLQAWDKAIHSTYKHIFVHLTQ